MLWYKDKEIKIKIKKHQQNIKQKETSNVNAKNTKLTKKIKKKW